MGRKKRVDVQKQFFADGEEKVDAGKTEKTQAVAVKKISPEQIEREYIDILNYQRKQRDNLFGNFSTGEYQIPDAIKAELLKIPKKFGEFEGNVSRVSTLLGRFVLNFKIVFTSDPDVCNAKLFIVEIEHDLEEDVKRETLLDEFEQARSEGFQKVAFERWNVFFDEDIFVKDSFLQNYLHMQEEDNLFLGELEMILSQLFVVRMLAFLDKMGELGDKIRVDFKLAMEKWLAKDPKYAQNFDFQKMLLDKIIAKHGAFIVIAKIEEGAKILLGYSTPLKNVRDKTYPSVVVEPQKPKEEKKSEKKASKPSVKKSSGKPAKKANPKTFKIDLSKVGNLNIGGGSSGARKTGTAPTSSKSPTAAAPPIGISKSKGSSSEKSDERNSWSKLIGGETKSKDDLHTGANKQASSAPPLAESGNSPEKDLENDTILTEEKNIGGEKPNQSALEFNL